MNEQKLGPGYYALGAFFVIPFAGVALVFFGLLMLVGWPVWPFYLYVHRKQEIAKEPAPNETLRPQ
jgi:hypothetical protein